ncbi:protein of unknown function [Zunongwangia mangrovi]|uniref:DUF4294 domain-containing protein n=2 Tax=Flavobacteriaceae TaxID=49546 RepID=A0A1I1IWK5_9FLAO|nr:protein of unknown function [Zunongwangia mangrovi]
MLNNTRVKTILFFITCLFPFFGIMAQTDTIAEPEEEDKRYMIIAGDSIVRESIDLDEVLILKRLQFKNNTDRRRYLILRRKTRKVYPYAKLAAERLTSLNERLGDIKSKRDRKKYTKIVQNYIEDQFAEELKKMTHTEGQILVKLIHRQTGITAFELIKELRSGWRAFWYNTTASLFEISLKEEYDPINNEEDYIIEDILQRSFQHKVLEPQPSALDFDFLELTDKWDVL